VGKRVASPGTIPLCMRAWESLKRVLKRVLRYKPKCTSGAKASLQIKHLWHG